MRRLALLVATVWAVGCGGNNGIAPLPEEKLPTYAWDYAFQMMRAELSVSSQEHTVILQAARDGLGWNLTSWGDLFPDELSALLDEILVETQKRYPEAVITRTTVEVGHDTEPHRWVAGLFFLRD